MAFAVGLCSFPITPSHLLPCFPGPFPGSPSQGAYVVGGPGKEAGGKEGREGVGVPAGLLRPGKQSTLACPTSRLWVMMAVVGVPNEADIRNMKSLVASGESHWSIAQRYMIPRGEVTAALRGASDRDYDQEARRLEIEALSHVRLARTCECPSPSLVDRGYCYRCGKPI